MKQDDAKKEAPRRVVVIGDGKTVRFVEVPADPLKALRGIGRGEGLRERLLEERRMDAGRG